MIIGAHYIRCLNLANALELELKYLPNTLNLEERVF